jgi:hypothetical protein
MSLPGSKPQAASSDQTNFIPVNRHQIAIKPMQPWTSPFARSNALRLNPLPLHAQPLAQRTFHA